MQKLIVGFDEAGRGPLAGPVTAGCVVLPFDFPVDILNDSKKLSEKKRKAAEILIKEKACWGFARVEHDEIDRINILNASLKAMSMAFDDMCAKLPSWLSSQGMSDCDGNKMLDLLEGIADGTFCPDVECAVRAEPKADANYPAVMAASIIAKVERDRIMCDYDKLYPQYGYKKHKGYPTKAHREICHQIGVSPIQRLSFKY